MNMFKPSKATSIPEYLSSVPLERKETVEFLHSFIQKTVPKLKPYFASNMIGYGSFPYRNYKKEMITWPIISLVNQKSHISLYVCAVSGGKYLAESKAAELGNVKVGKSCINIKKIEDINLETLKKLLIEAEKNPGFGQ